jgi:DNA-binding transcriptional regulator GbsR (MarR family)
MAENSINEQLRYFSEDVGITFEKWGLPRMAGRIWGWLLVCDPPHQTAGDLVNILGASKGSVSTMTRMLEQNGFVERFGLPGDRATYYRVVEDMEEKLIESKLASIRILREMVRGGLDILAKEPPQRRIRLEKVHDLWSFLEKELPVMMMRFRIEQEHKERS